MKDKLKPDAKQPSRLKLLFADDEAALQELMSLEIPRMGHEVTVCPDGGTAVAALGRNTYDCIIVDLDMPGMNGIEVIDRCKKLAPETDTFGAVWYACVGNPQTLPLLGLVGSGGHGNPSLNAWVTDAPFVNTWTPGVSK